MFNEYLRKKYPLMFTDLEGNPSVSTDVGPGWWPIVDAYCSVVYAQVHRFEGDLAWALQEPPEPTPRRDAATLEADRKMTQRRLLVAKMGVGQVVEIKEKFGGLRIYTWPSWRIEQLTAELLATGGELTSAEARQIEEAGEIARGAYEMATATAERTCMICAQPGHSTKGGWVVTLCDEHHALCETRTGFHEAWHVGRERMKPWLLKQD